MNSQTNQTSALLKEQGYSMYHFCRLTKRGGGTAIIARNTFVPKPAKSMSFQTFEVFIQSLKISNDSQPVTLVSLYRLGSETKSNFITEFHTFLEYLMTNFTYFLICGDFNIHVNMPNDVFVSNFNDVLDTFSLVQSVHGPTHVCGNTLDLIIHDPTVINICDIYVEEPDRSDHSVVFFKMHCNLEINEKKKISFRNFHNIDTISFQNDIANNQNNFLENCNENNFENAVSLFQQIFGEIVNSHAPIVTKTVNVNTKPGWLDQEFRSARSERRKHYKTWKRTQTIADREKFKISRQEVQELSIVKRKQYFSKCVAESSNSQRELFKICSSLLDTQKYTSLPESNDSHHLANMFNQFFIQKIVKIRHDMISLKLNNLYVNKLEYGIGVGTCARSTLSSFKPVTAEDLKKIMLSRKIKTSAEDTIPAQLLKSSLDEILPALTKLVNISFSTGSIEGLKDSVITPLLKKQGLDQETLSNYRPVANILYLSKLIETNISLQVHDHMDLNYLHIPYQSGYKAYHSCETLLLSLNNDILKAFDGGECVILLLLDLSAAFDTVDHDRLLKILHEEIGLRGVALRWFESYLSNRRQAVKVNGKVSDYLGTSHGVPQGSVLGPILFNIYIRSFIRLLNEAGFVAHGYADDHQVLKLFSIKFQYEAIRCSIPRILDIIAHWMKASFLKLNSSKSQVIIFTPQNQSSQIHIDQIKLSDGTMIPISRIVNNLGVRFDSELSYTSQINAICSSGYRLLRNLASVRKFLTKDDLRTLVQAIVVSRIDNCNSLLYGILARNINKLQKLQNACARVIHGKRKRDHVSPLLKELHWLPVRQRIIFKILLFVFKFFHNIAPVYIANTLIKCENREFVLIIPRTNTKYGDRAFSNCAPRLWNALPLSIRASCTASYFRSHLKHHLFANFDAFMANANIYTA